MPNFVYIQYLVQHHQQPTAERARSGESHQPPLCNILAAVAIGWIPHRGFQVIANPDFAFDDRNNPNLLIHDAREQFPYREDVLAWHIARLVSIVLGTVTIWATWQIAQEVFPDDTAIAFGASAFVAFLPSFIALSAVVNNDNLVIALTSLGVLQIVRMWHRGMNQREAVKLGVLLGMSALTSSADLPRGFLLDFYFC